MKYIYLDTNIIIDLQNNRNKDIQTTIDELDRSKHKLVFSPAHIEEIAGIVKHHNQPQERADNKLVFLKELTQCHCLLPFPNNTLKLVRRNGINMYLEDPFDTYSRVIEQFDRNIIAEQHQKEKLLRGEFRSDNSVSNLSVNKLLNEYKPRLLKAAKSHHKQMKKDPVLKEYVPKGSLTEKMLKFRSSKSYFPVFEMIVEMCMEYLEYSRFYPDKSKKHISSLHDTTHAIYGAYTDVFVTNDDNFAQKIKGVYDWLGVQTKVVKRSEFIENY